MSKIVAIDGPGSSGKNSVGLGLAERLGFQFIDSGSIYRAVAYYALHRNYSVDDWEKLAREFLLVDVSFEDNDEGQWVFLGDENITHSLHSKEVTQNVYVFSRIEQIREVVRHKQHEVADTRDTVMAGRDTGTVIFPNAPVKFYITASVEVRAKRRYSQLVAEGISASYEEILTMLIDRDTKDSTREHSPLKPAVDAIILDTSEMSVDEVVDKMYSICVDRFNRTA